MNRCGFDTMRNLRVLLLINLITISCATLLSGPNVCSKIVDEPVVLTETYLEPVIVPGFTWCMQLPPRCKQDHTEMRLRQRDKILKEKKMTTVCCDGYKIHKLNDNVTTCIPHCNDCVEGTCTAPNKCQCNPGYEGDNCANECSEGRWGDGCKNQCSCHINFSCNHINGTCQCPTLFEGFTCDELIPVLDYSTDEVDDVEAKEDLINPTTTDRGIVVLVSIPDAKIHDKDDNFHNRLTVRGTLTDKVPSRDSPIVNVPLDIILVIIAFVVSLGLTCVAVAMALYMRSKLIQAIGLPIYEDNNKTTLHEKVGIKEDVKTATTNPQENSFLHERESVTSQTDLQGRILTFDEIDSSNNHYANEAIIGLRISRNLLRDFLRNDHYDRPPSTLIRFEQNLNGSAEHVYDEIPLQPGPIHLNK